MEKYERTPGVISEEIPVGILKEPLEDFVDKSSKERFKQSLEIFIKNFQSKLWKNL